MRVTMPGDRPPSPGGCLTSALSAYFVVCFSCRSEKPSNPDPQEIARPTVLIVDDEPSIQQLAPGALGFGVALLQTLLS
jgi:hypothetical protein